MTNVAFFRCYYMTTDFTGCGNVVMTGAAFAGNLGVINLADSCPAYDTMAGFAVISGVDVSHCLAGGIGAVMTGDTIILNVLMRKLSLCPGNIAGMT